MSSEVEEHELSLLEEGADNPNGEAEKIEDTAKEEARENSNNPSSQLKIKFADQVDEEAKKTPRFMVENVESPTTSPAKNNANEFPYPDPGETIGFPTHEAVPMTLFYRNQSSVGDSAAQRPTLKSLHKSYDDIDEENMDEAPMEGSTQGIDAEVKASLPLPRLKFGWFKGVLVPCLLNIWGVILYLRLPWLTGQAGIGLMSLIILLAAVVTTITTLSMSAICTNGQVKGGGAYYLISRSLGPEFGGSIGIIFSLANAVGVALYVVGFSETIQKLMAEHGAMIIDPVNDVRIIGLIVVVFLVGITLIGLEWVVRAQIFLLAILILSMLDYIFGTMFGPLDMNHDVIKSQGFTGFSKSTFSENFAPTFRGENFFTTFSIFFPAATGILAGANISGDLKDPQTAVPKGTLLAIIITTISYIGFVWVIGSTTLKDAAIVTCTTAVTNITSASPTITANLNATATGLKGNTTCVTGEMKYGLLNDMKVIEKVSLFGPIVLAGIFAATLSSALASLVGSPKTFQAVCKDGVFKGLEFFGKGSGPNDEPRRANVLAFFISAGFIVIGELNVIAPIISNFFLMSYALINYSVFAASLGKSPGWRPSFKYHNMWLSLFGCGICIAIMFLVNWWASLVTIVIVMSLYKYVAYKRPEINWGSSGQAHTYRKALQLSLSLNEVEDHVKNFRPQCLVLTGLPSLRSDLAYFVSYITKHVGLMLCGQVVIAKGDELDIPNVVNQDKWLRRNKIKAFHVITSAPTLRLGVQAMIQNAGLGKLRPNILVVGFKDDWQTANVESVIEYTDVIHDAFDFNYGVAILRLPKGTHLEEDSDWEGGEGSEYGESDAELSKGEAANEPKQCQVKIEETILDVDTDLESETPASTPMILRDSKQTSDSKESDTPSNKRKQESAKKYNEHVMPPLTEKRKGFVDVWWLLDDGGLTMLLPHLLMRNRIWRECSLRVFTAASTRKLKSNEVRMASLLKKFRIDVSAVIEVTGINSRPSPESIKKFREMPTGEESADSEFLDKKTLRQIRLAELLQEHSSESKLVVLTLPIPRKSAITPLLFMAWLDTLSAHLPPVLFVRGNQASVLTFYS